jgi:hypothetical protein
MPRQLCALLIACRVHNLLGIPRPWTVTPLLEVASVLSRISMNAAHAHATTFACVCFGLQARLCTAPDAAPSSRCKHRLMQESEGTDIPPEISSKGVKTLLETPSKGHFYVIRVCARRSHVCVCAAFLECRLTSNSLPNNSRQV